VTTTTALVTTTAPPPPALPTESGPLQAGTQGARTQALQQALADQHYDPGTLDGRFGLKTTLAVWAWQALHGVPQTGVVTPDLEPLVLARTPQPMLRPDLGPDHTEIDLTRQVLLLFAAGKPRLISHISSGSGRHYCDRGNCGTAITPTGSYHYQRRISGWRTAPLGRLYNPVYFNGGIAVHGATSVPAVPASHGCIRLPMHIAEYFPSLVANGDAVAVFRT
jgi:peptidoglycan hydrolase-like protein with peptidoglycan-binding domain